MFFIWFLVRFSSFTNGHGQLDANPVLQALFEM